MLSPNTNNLLSPKPPSPPPGVNPQYCPFLKHPDTEFFKQHLKKIVYIWTKYGNSFWIYPVDTMDYILFCYAWDGSDWNYIRMDTNLIDSFY